MCYVCMMVERVGVVFGAAVFFAGKISSKGGRKGGRICRPKLVRGEEEEGNTVGHYSRNEYLHNTYLNLTRDFISLLFKPDN